MIIIVGQGKLSPDRTFCLGSNVNIEDFLIITPRGTLSIKNFKSLREQDVLICRTDYLAVTNNPTDLEIWMAP